MDGLDDWVGVGKEPVTGTADCTSKQDAKSTFVLNSAEAHVSFFCIYLGNGRVLLLLYSIFTHNLADDPIIDEYRHI